MLFYIIGKPYNLYRISPSMNRLNLKIYMLNWKCREHLYAIRCMNDKEEERKRRKEIVMLVEEKEVWEGIREGVRKGGERI